MKINELANLIAKKMNTEIEEIYEEEQESDAGFQLVNGYGLQLSPYLPKPYVVSMFHECNGCLENLGEFNTEQEFIDSEIK